jgi:hypothetical protein
MGLDMYLKGEKFFSGTNGDRPKEDGFPVARHELELGYWRKHPNLHGFIVKTFAEGRDECQKIHLGEKDLTAIMAAIQAEQLPPTSGFFFGASDGSEKPEDLEIFQKALAWIREPKQVNVWRSVIYRASW